ncbi:MULTISPECIES: hypothetical protein [Thiorhodovibrio]|uniref:hypothetical protein n=1 Tax=Thiorhodovibrio TaxID=61593 RepID=UPI001911AB9C|nr:MULTISPECIES: hypothetical protein [Thiorhodovibrio]MBK5968937.1 hypothetical protein [Thiorhodovibrio winogradskyi]WPL10348.1 hypothetical protein Thiosp_00060 [Thiorhodovibrio litoralis]
MALLLFTTGALASASTADLERRVAELQRQLAEAEQALQAAQTEAETANAKAAAAEAKLTTISEPAPKQKITLGPVTIGGAIRANYILGSYPGGGDGPSRGGNGGNFALDTFRLNMDLKYNQLVGKFEYRWYDGYNFLHTGWLGWDFDDGSQLQVGVNRVPFGPGAYGVSQSWFFDQHYYVGLSDDMDLGIKYSTSIDNWDLDFAYYARSEWNGNGTSQDSARYSYDIVTWDSGIAANGDVIAAATNGYTERNQFNIRAIYGIEGAVDTHVGVSLQYGQLKGRRADDGHHWAVSAHMTNAWDNWLLATQITRYKISIDDNNLLGTDQLVPMGAYNFAWPAATDAWIPAVSLSYKHTTGNIPWLDSVRPYIEYSSIVKEDNAFNDSQLVTLGAAWASGGWYIYTDLAFSDGNYFVGNETKDGTAEGFSNIYSPTLGAGDFGADANNDWNYRFNINFGYYF